MNIGGSSDNKSTESFIRSLYSDPFKWNLLKSVTLFAAAVFFAREMAIASSETSV